MARFGSAIATLAYVVLCAHNALAAADLERARVLDQEGVRAYKEERYNDAIRFFQEAFRTGGPPTELWNVARCRLRMDDPEGAADEIRAYLKQPGVTPGDKAEAQEQLREIEHRPSAVLVTSSPSGAAIFVDGKRNAPVGVTPATIDLPPGEHKVTVEHAGYDAWDKTVDAKLGRAVLVDAPLAHGDAPSTTPAPSEKPGLAALHPHRLILEGEIGAQFPRFGSIGGAGNVAGVLTASYVAMDASRLVVTVGARFMLTGDSWSNTIDAPARGANCGSAIPNEEGATALSAFVTGGLAYRATSRWRVGGDLGMGFATYSVSEVGGDLFVPNCQPSPGVRPALHLGGEVSYALSHELRIVVTPLMFEVQPAFGGVRSSPKDASGIWLRYGFAAGLAFDLL